MNFSKTKSTKGFTLVELLVVIAVIAVFATVSVIGYTSFMKKAANSNDILLADQINTLLNGQRVYETLDNDNDIAKLLQEYLEKDVEIASLKYDMNIYYNTNSEQFELMQENQTYQTLAYYLNLDVPNETPDISQPDGSDTEDTESGDNNNNNSNNNNSNDVESETLNFVIDTNHHKTYGNEIFNSNQNKVKLSSYYENEALYIDVFINNLEDRHIVSTVDLAQIIKVENNENADITFTVTEIDLQGDYGSCDLQGSELKVYTPGKYQINYSYESIVGVLDLYVVNIYWENNPSIDISNLSIKYNSTKNTINFTKIYQMIINEYNYSTGWFDENIEVSEKKELLENTDIIIKIGEITQIVNMEQSMAEYNFSLESYNLSVGSSVSIQFRYQGYNGLYYFSTEKSIQIN